MKKPDHVADCMEAMAEAVDIPISVKCRIGIDDLDSFDFLDEFVSKIADKGCPNFIIHARKAWLQGLSPKQNREVPVLDYDRVALIKEKHPHLKIILNGGITTLEQITENTDRFDGFMIGREAYQNPYVLAELEHALWGTALPAREDIAKKMAIYAAQQAQAHGTPIKSITRHILGLYQGLPGAKNYRRMLSTLPHEDGADEGVILKAVARYAQAQNPQA